MSDAPEKKEGTEEAPKKKKSKKLFIIIGLLVVGLGAGVPMFLMGGDKKEGAVEEQKEEPKELKIADLGTFVVNLSDSASFLKVNIQIEYDAAVLAKLAASGGGGGGGGHGGGGSGGGESPGAVPAMLKEREPVYKDFIIRTLSAKKTEEVLSLDGKEKLREELIETINEASGFEEPAITNVYFSDFIVQ